MKISDKFIEKCNKDLRTQIPLGTKLKYLNPTINQQARGMMMWVFDHYYYQGFGSSVGIKELLKRDKLEISAAYNTLSCAVAVGVK